jgi:hypothetical protein
MSISSSKLGNFLSNVKNTFSNLIGFNMDEKKEYNEFNYNNKNDLNDTPSLSEYDDLSQKFNNNNQRLRRKEYLNGGVSYMKDNFREKQFDNEKKVNSLLKITQYINDDKFNINMNNNNLNNSNLNSLNSSAFKQLNNSYLSKTFENKNLSNSNIYNKKYLNPLYKSNNNYLGKKNPKRNGSEKEKEIIPQKYQKQNAISDLIINNKSLEEIRKEIELKRKINENKINEMNQNSILKNIKLDYEEKKKTLEKYYNEKLPKNNKNEIIFINDFFDNKKLKTSNSSFDFLSLSHNEKVSINGNKNNKLNEFSINRSELSFESQNETEKNNIKSSLFSFDNLEKKKTDNSVFLVGKSKNQQNNIPRIFPNEKITLLNNVNTNINKKNNEKITKDENFNINIKGESIFINNNSMINDSIPEKEENDFFSQEKKNENENKENNENNEKSIFSSNIPLQPNKIEKKEEKKISEEVDKQKNLFLLNKKEKKEEKKEEEKKENENTGNEKKENKSLFQNENISIFNLNNNEKKEEKSDKNKESNLGLKEEEKKIEKPYISIPEEKKESKKKITFNTNKEENIIKKEEEKKENFNTFCNTKIENKSDEKQKISLPKKEQNFLPTLTKKEEEKVEKEKRNDNINNTQDTNKKPDVNLFQPNSSSLVNSGNPFISNINNLSGVLSLFGNNNSSVNSNNNLNKGDSKMDISGSPLLSQRTIDNKEQKNMFDNNNNKPLFGLNNNPESNNKIFGGPNNNNSGSIFTNNNNNTGSIFTNNTNMINNNGNIFGNISSTGSTNPNSLFGNDNNMKPNSLFGNNNNNNGNLFTNNSIFPFNQANNSLGISQNKNTPHLMFNLGKK